VGRDCRPPQRPQGTGAGSPGGWFTSGSGWSTRTGQWSGGPRDGSGPHRHGSRRWVCFFNWLARASRTRLRRADRWSLSADAAGPTPMRTPRSAATCCGARSLSIRRMPGAGCGRSIWRCVAPPPRWWWLTAVGSSWPRPAGCSWRPSGVGRWFWWHGRRRSWIASRPRPRGGWCGGLLQLTRPPGGSLSCCV
jgi:hypothetical protein